jgi:archaellum biogenesis ATPase FlaH
VLDAMQAHPIVRVATGIAELDQRTNGGPRLRDLVAILGAPDAGKTTLAAHLADVMSAAGFIVGFIASDEDEESVTTRFAQRRNWSRADVDAREDFRDLREQMPAVHLYDLEWALEDVIEDLAERAANKPAVLIVDSLQTMNVGAAADGMGKADAIPLGLRFLRTAARVRRWLVIFTSEMVRGSYSGNGDRTAALASAKWSGDVEYSAKLMLALRNVDDSPDLLHVEISKSKICAKGEFHLRIDRAHQRLEAAEAPDKAERKQVKAQHDARELEQSATKLVKIVLSNPGIGTRTLHAKASVAGVGGRDRVDAVIEYCVDAGFIVDRPETHKSRIDHHYFVPSATEAGAAAAQ